MSSWSSTPIAPQIAAAIAADNALDSATYLTQGSQVFSVKDAAYGAVGNGIADDTAAINAAVGAARSVNGVAYFPPGTYRVTAQIGLNGNDYVLRGAGAGSVIKMGNAANLNQILLVDSGSGVSIESLKLDGNRAAQTAGNGRAVTIYNASTVTLRNVIFTATFGEAVVTDMPAPTDAGVTIEGCRSSNIGSRTLSLVGVRNSIVRGCTFAGTSANETVHLTDCARSIFASNILTTLAIAGGPARQAVFETSDSMVVSGNHLTGSPDDGICIQASTRSAVTGNTVYGVAGNIGPGIALWLGATFCTVTGNTVTAFQHGIVVDGSPGTANNSDNLITGNTVTGCTSTGIKSDAATPTTNRRVLITGNLVNANTGAGIVVIGDSDYIKVTTNFCSGNTTSQVTDTSGKANNLITGNY